MRTLRHALLPAVALAVFMPAASAQAISPQNPYRSFNLSGINYGSMQWERDQRAGRRVWPYFNTPTRTTTRDSGVWVGGVVGGGSAAGTIIRAGGSNPVPRSSPRVFRRWRR
jgi:hypothetical protein